VPEHLRVIKSTTPKKPGGRHDFPEGLEEQIILLDAPDKPVGARCVGYVGDFGESLPVFRCKAYHPFKDVKAV
jgi:hypothetical protein